AAGPRRRRRAAEGRLVRPGVDRRAAAGCGGRAACRMALPRVRLLQPDVLRPVPDLRDALREALRRVRTTAADDRPGAGGVAVAPASGARTREVRAARRGDRPRGPVQLRVRDGPPADAGAPAHRLRATLR